MLLPLALLDSHPSVASSTIGSRRFPVCMLPCCSSTVLLVSTARMKRQHSARSISCQQAGMASEESRSQEEGVVRLCNKIADPEHRKLAWSAWHRTLPSAFAPLNSIKLSPQQPLPSSHTESLNRMTEHFAPPVRRHSTAVQKSGVVLDAVEQLQQTSVAGARSGRAASG